MDAGYPSHLLQELVAIPSPSGAEGAAAGFLLDEMLALGLDAHIDAVGNVIGQKGREGPRILLLGHLDTVPEQLPVVCRDGILRGRGAVDAKGPLVALVCAAASADVPCRLQVVAAVGEETPGSPGTRHLVAHTPQPDAVVVGEPTGSLGATIGYKGRFSLRYDVLRPAAHTSTPEEKAVEQAVEFWLTLRDRYHAGTRFQDVAASLIRLDGDVENAQAEIVLRVPPGFNSSELDAWLGGAARGGEIAFDERTPAVLRDRLDPVVQALLAAIRTRGHRPRLKLKSGTSDMNVIASTWQVPIAAYGPGDSRLDHTLDERVSLSEVDEAVTVLQTALNLLASSLAERTASRVQIALDEEEERLVTERLRALGYLE